MLYFRFPPSRLRMNFAVAASITMVLALIYVPLSNTASAEITDELPSCDENVETPTSMPTVPTPGVTPEPTATVSIYLPSIVRSDERRNTVANRDSTTCADILSPSSGATVSDKEIQLVGRLESTVQDLQVRLQGVSVTAESSGQFTIPAILFYDGENVLTLEFFDGDNLIGTKSVSVLWVAPADAATQISPNNGGSVEVIDPQSSVFGAGIMIPPDAPERSFRVRIGTNPEHIPNLPYGNEFVGPAVVFAPIGETFLAPVTIKVPVDPSLLPGNTDIDDVEIHGFTDDGWTKLPVVLRGNNFVQTQVDNLAFGYIAATVNIPLKEGEVRISTSPAYATLYIDGFDTGVRTPATLSNIIPGEHTIKVYLSGFNEVFQVLDVPLDGTAVDIELERPTAPVPVVDFDTFIQNGMEVFDNVFTVSGNVSYDGSALVDGKAVVSLNDIDSLIDITDGRFENEFSLLPGENTLEVRVTGPNGSTGVSQRITIINNESTQQIQGAMQYKSAADDGITVILTWDTNYSDLDLHVFDPLDNHAWFGALDGIPGGQLDVDDVDGFGPETFTMQQPISGTYEINVNYFEKNGSGPTTASLQVFIGSNLQFSESYRFTAADSNEGGGRGANSESFWNAYDLTIGLLKIVSVETIVESPQDKAIFTTHPDENLITVEVKAPEDVSDEDIFFEIKEINEDFALETNQLQVVDREMQFSATHERLKSLTDPPKSHPLTYEIVAYTLNEQGERELESQPARLVQDDRSQIRQEYIDKREILSTFARSTPERNTIIDASEYRNPGNFSFEEIAAYSDFSGLAVIVDSANIAQAVRNAWGKPVRVTSGWRNPRRNDRLANSNPNSFHQTGDAIDLNPGYGKDTWPQGVLTYEDAQKKLTEIARETLDLSVYDTLFHANHLHIERDPNGAKNR